MTRSKYCPACEITRPITDFWKNRYNFDGLQSRCSECQYETNTAWAASHPEAHLRLARKHSIAYYKKRKIDPAVFARIAYTAMKQRVSRNPAYRNTKILMSVQDLIKTTKSRAFRILYRAWRRSGYRFKYVPTVDRIDILGDYTSRNVQWLTMSQSTIKKNTVDKRRKEEV